MNDMTVREQSKEFTAALLRGDLQTAFTDLSDEAKDQMEQFIPSLPSPVETADIKSVVPQGDAFVVNFDIAGGGRELALQTVWEERDGRQVIVSVTGEPSTGLV